MNIKAMAQPQAAFQFLDPPPMRFGDVSLHLERKIPADSDKGLVPVYRFGIQNETGQRVGHISFKVGDTEHITRYAGHIGYLIDEPFRGRAYATQACLALRPFIARYYREVIITSDVDNPASIKTIRRIGAGFIDRAEVPPALIPDGPGIVAYKNRYRWKIGDVSGP